jgi:predicted nucleic acid-binding protein
VVPEAETGALQAELAQHDEWLSASIVVTEVVRATRRWLDAVGAGARARRARLDDAESIVRRVALLDMDLPLVWAAARADPTTLRSLDAIHLATATQVADDIYAVITYDVGLAAAAGAAGLRIAAPA